MSWHAMRISPFLSELFLFLDNKNNSLNLLLHWLFISERIQTDFPRKLHSMHSYIGTFSYSTRIHTSIGFPEFYFRFSKQLQRRNACHPQKCDIHSVVLCEFGVTRATFSICLRMKRLPLDHMNSKKNFTHNLRL